jgi:hypothetical protein
MCLDTTRPLIRSTRPCDILAHHFIGWLGIVRLHSKHTHPVHYCDSISHKPVAHTNKCVWTRRVHQYVQLGCATYWRTSLLGGSVLYALHWKHTNPVHYCASITHKPVAHTHKCVSTRRVQYTFNSAVRHTGALVYWVAPFCKLCIGNTPTRYTTAPVSRTSLLHIPINVSRHDASNIRSTRPCDILAH